MSEYVAYFDECGDHGMEKISPDFPVFVLCGCIFQVKKYVATELGEFSAIKFAHFGHDAVVFHSREIRKRLGPFQVLSNIETRSRFMSDIAEFYRRSSFCIVAAAINKSSHRTRYAAPVDPYGISLLFCLERLYGHMKDRAATARPVTCIFERRGNKEDNALAAEFARICSGANQWGPLPFHIVFASKQANMPGLQIADLAAYPIARHIMDRTAINPAFDAVATRIRKSPQGKMEGWGLKEFP